MKPRRVALVVAGLTVAGGVALWVSEREARRDFDLVAAHREWELAEEFQNALIDRFELKDVSLDEAVALLNRHAQAFSKPPRQVRFLAWKEGDPLPPGLRWATPSWRSRRARRESLDWKKSPELRILRPPSPRRSP